MLKFEDLTLEDKSQISTDGEYDQASKVSNSNEYGSMMLKLERGSYYQGERLKGKVLIRLN